MTDLEIFLENIDDTLNKASLNHDIWRMYKLERKPYIDIMNDNRYLLFFTVSIHAHFVACVIALYRLFETRKDTNNIPNFIQSLKKRTDFSEEKLQEMIKILDTIKPIWVKISILRNEVFGHQNKDNSIEEIFKKADLKIDDFQKIIDESKKIIDIAYYEISKSFHPYLNAAPKIKNILEDLKSLKINE